MERVVNEVGGMISSCSPRPVIVAGDFNAHHTAWRCSSRQLDTAGRALMEWTAEIDKMINQGQVSTCVRPNGECIVNLSWATPSIAQRIVDWAVDPDEETLSDHRWIGWGVRATAGQVLSCPEGANPRK